MLHLGLTGGIGSGKSTVAAMLADLGASIVDADAIARSLTTRGGAAIGAIIATFGDDVVAADGSLDRDRMRKLAFGDAHAKRQLEGILHPLIAAHAAHQAQQARGDVVVFDVPLLAESPTWRARVARIVVVDCREATQIERVSRRPGWSVEAASRVVSQQASRERRRAIADAMIANDNITLDALRSHVHALWARWIPRP